MPDRSPENSTNVRFGPGREIAPALVAFVLWGLFVGLMKKTGALATLGDELPWLTAFACAVAALAYGVDAELRHALEDRRGIAMLVGIGAALASSLDPTAMLAFAPAVAICVAALTAAAVARVSSAVAASPGARPDAL